MFDIYSCKQCFICSFVHLTSWECLCYMNPFIRTLSICVIFLTFLSLDISSTCPFSCFIICFCELQCVRVSVVYERVQVFLNATVSGVGAPLNNLILDDSVLSKLTPYHSVFLVVARSALVSR